MVGYCPLRHRLYRIARPELALVRKGTVVAVESDLLALGEVGPIRLAEGIVGYRSRHKQSAQSS